MQQLHHLFIEINNQLLFITEEEELTILTQYILQWKSTSDGIASLAAISQYMTYERMITTTYELLAIQRFTTKLFHSEFIQTMPITTPFSFLLSIELYILTNPHSIQSPQLPILLKRYKTLVSEMNTYSITYYALVFVCLFIQYHPIEDSERLLFIFKFAMVINSTSVMQFVFLLPILHL